MPIYFKSDKDAIKIASDLEGFIASQGSYAPQSVYRHAIALVSGYKNWDALLDGLSTPENLQAPDNISEEVKVGCLMGALSISHEIAKLAFETINETIKEVTKKNETKASELASLWIMEWEESERGWGVRPDGYSIHASKEAYETYLANYRSRMPKEVPNEYDRPACSEPEHYLLPEDHFLIKKMLAGTIRIFRHVNSSEDNVYHQVQSLISGNSGFTPERCATKFGR